MARFHPLTIKDIRQETNDCVSIAFDVPENLADTFSFLPGQYLTLKTDIQGEEVRRSYSICSAPDEGELRVAIKQVEGGKFSTHANHHLQINDALESMVPTGNFYPTLDASNAKHYLLFAAGSGITPILSIIKSVLTTEPKSQITLFYGNRTIDSIIFRETLEDLKNTYLNRLSLHHILSREHLGAALFKGRIDKEKCASFFKLLVDPKTANEFFICGPEQMIHAVRESLEDVGVDKKNIHFELFTTPTTAKAAKAKKVEQREAFEAAITIQLDGDTFDLSVLSDGDSILDTALKNGMDLPFACKGGVCCTCRAKVEEGKVEMDVNYALEEDEVEAGFVLTCQAHPLTDKVVVNFDV